MSLIDENDYDAGFKKIYLKAQLRTNIDENGVERKDLETVSIMPKRWTEADFNYNSKDNKDRGFGHVVRCGPENNITVVDYDDDDLYKRDVADFFKDTCQEFYTVKTRRGWHVYFEYDPDIKEYNPKFASDRGGQHKIDTLTKSTKCVFGIGTNGIRKNGEDFDYNYMWGTVKKMPDKFKDRFILNNPNIKAIQEYTSTIDYDYNIDDDELREILRLLNEFDSDYFNDYNKWLTFTAIMKTLDKKEIWDELSKEYDLYNKYNKRKNESTWRSSTAKISINYFTKILKIPKIVFRKAEENFYCDVTEFEDRYNEMNSKYINMLDDLGEEEETEEMPSVGKTQEILDNFKDNQVIFLDSPTGTGKSSCFFSKFRPYSEQYKQYTVLSIVDLRSLALQQMKTAEDNGVILRSYREKKMCKSLMMLENTVICINSIYRLANSNFSKKIIFIDEIHSLLKTLTEGSLIHNKNLIYSILKRMIKDCHKIVVSDAHIFKHVMCLLDERINDGKSNFVYFKNTFKKYKGVNAFKYDGEQDFFNRIRYLVSKGIPFVFASDNKSILTDRFNKFKEEADEKTKKIMFLYSADESPDNDEDDGKEETLPDWNGKIIFYTPTIKHGVSIETKAKVEQFIYISGLSVDAISLYQMATRTRNMKQLNYYSCARGVEAKYKDLSECQLKMAEEYITNFKQLSLLPKESYKLIRAMMDDEENKENNDTFKTLYDYNVYFKDYYGTNPTYYFEKEIKRVGFKIGVKNDSKKVPQEDIEAEKLEIQEISESRQNDRYEELKGIIHGRNRIGKGIMDDDDDEEDKPMSKAVENMIKRVDILKLSNSEQLDLYRDLIEDEYMFDDFMNFTRLLKDKYIADSKVVEVMKGKMVAGLHSNVWIKIMYIHKIADVLNIHNKVFNLDGIVEPAESVIKSEEVQTIINNVKQLYKKRDVTPSRDYTGYDMVKLYKFMLNAEVGLLKIIKSEQSKKKATRDKISYVIVEDTFKKYMDLVDIMRKGLGKFNPMIIKEVEKEEVVKKDVKKDVKTKNITKKALKTKNVAIVEEDDIDDLMDFIDNMAEDDF